MQCIRLAWSLARFNAGIKIAINTAMIAITTNNSINVKALVFIFTSPFQPKTSLQVRGGNNPLTSIITDYQIKDAQKHPSVLFLKFHVF
jgi:hypothetical protein